MGMSQGNPHGFLIVLRFCWYLSSCMSTFNYRSFTLKLEMEMENLQGDHQWHLKSFAWAAWKKKTFWHITVGKSRAVKDKMSDYWIELLQFEDPGVAGAGSLSRLTGNSAIVNVISNTYASPAMTCQNVYCEISHPNNDNYLMCFITPSGITDYWLFLSTSNNIAIVVVLMWILIIVYY